MKCFHFRSIEISIVACGLWLAGAPAAAGALQSAQSAANAQSSSKPKPATQSRIQKVANPLNDLLDEAQRDIDNKNFEAAIAPLQKVIADQPEFVYAHFQLAYVYTALKKADEARAEYERTIALDPKMGEAYLNLGLLFLQSNPPGSDPAFDRAVPPLRKAVELMPGQKQPLRTLAVAQERSGDVNGAEESFGALLRLDPDDLDGNTFVGGQFLRKNMPQEAEARFRHALEHYPGFPPALVGLARSLEEQKKAGEAVDVYRQSLARVPNRDIRVRIVHLLMEQEQYDAALAELDRVPKFELGRPDDPIPRLEALKLRADIQIAQKKWDDATITLREATALAPNDAQLHGGLGRIYLQKRDFADAEKELRIAMRLDGMNLDYWKDLSSTLFLGGNYPAALATLDEIAKMEQPGAGVWFVRAICYDKLNQPKLALEAYQKFLELDQDKNPDQVWQAKERSKVLQRVLGRKR
jgi:tetratricopeptide (TPR) repeat protein